VDVLCEQLLAGAGPSHQQHRQPGRGGAAGERHGALQGGGTAEDRLEIGVTHGAALGVHDEAKPAALHLSALWRVHRLCAVTPVAQEDAVTELLFVVEEAAEGGYTARAVGASIVTEAADLDGLRTAVRDAVRCHFDPAALPKLIRLHVVRDEIIAA
jgi:hypothetical protein